MPCILKQSTSRSPGVITFTHNEVLRGVPNKFGRVRDYLTNTAASKKWIYGVHIQGDCSDMASWPVQPWQSFYMWADPSASFLSNIPREKILPLTCINFMPEFAPDRGGAGRKWDVCVVSRASEIKRITETLHLLRCLLDIRPSLKVVVIVPDARKQELGDRAYRTQGIDRNFFELPRRMFTSEELKGFSFLCSSQIAFGNFPLSADLVSELVEDSRFLLLTSHKEGVPRVIAEALLVGTPCVVSRFLKSGVQEFLNERNCILIEDDPKVAARQIAEGLENPGRFRIDREDMSKAFGERAHLPALRSYLSGLIGSAQRPVEGGWYLDDLHLRLACHGQKHNVQFMNNDKLFFDWISRIESSKDGKLDEDYLFGSEPLDDEERFSIERLKNYARDRIFSRLKRAISSFDSKRRSQQEGKSRC